MSSNVWLSSNPEGKGFTTTNIYILMMHLIQQRVLEHCEDKKTQDKVMGEILACVSMLARDQYGNYVQICRIVNLAVLITTLI